MEHISVLLNESIDMLQIKEDGIYVDCTLGRGGHSSEILKRLTSGHLYAFDCDQNAIDESAPRLQAIGDNFTLIHSPFENLKSELAKRGVTLVDGIFMDLGVSSPQFDDGQRGFSYRSNARLDMRMDQSQELDAYAVVNTYDKEDLIRILKRYGEEPFAVKIANKICSVREKAPIETTFELVDVIKSALPAAVLRKKGHPAKQTFQAIRISRRSPHPSAMALFPGKYASGYIQKSGFHRNPYLRCGILPRLSLQSLSAASSEILFQVVKNIHDCRYKGSPDHIPSQGNSSYSQSSRFFSMPAALPQPLHA